MEAVVERFLSVTDGYGDGDGSGSGSGSGDGYGVTAINGKPVYLIDGIQTLIRQVRGNVARGQILQADLTLKDCFVVKVGDKFAHGDTLAAARRDAENKAFQDLSEEDRIKAFNDQFKTGKAYLGSEFFEWHAKLTGSCEMGRMQFVKDNGIDLGKTYTVAEFVAITRSAYRGDIVKRLIS